MGESRTQKSVKNASVSFVFLFINLALSFLSRPIFIEGLGDELLGVRTTVTNLLGTLGLAELGLGAVIGYALYKPLYEKDTATLNEIMTIQAWCYRYVTWVVCIASAGILAFFPYFFRDSSVPLWAAYATYGTLLWQVAMSYLVSYRSIIFGADQKGYKLTLNTQGVMISKVIIQMLIVKLLPDPYVYYLVVEFVVTLIGIYILEWMIRKHYPWLRVKPSQGRALLKKHGELLKKTGQMIVHKVAGIVLGNIAPLIMLKFSSLVMITHYENYMTITRNTGAVLAAVVGSIGAGIGSLVAEGNISKTIKFFWEYNALVHFFTIIICWGIYSFSDDFIILWIGANYIIDEWVLVMIVANLYINLTRQTRDNFIYAKGLFGDIAAPIIESILTIGLSALGGYYWGLAGVVGGIVVSLALIVVGWKSYYLFQSGFGLSMWDYWRHYTKYLFISAVSIYGGRVLTDMYVPQASNFLELILWAGGATVFFATVLLGLLYPLSEGTRAMSTRIGGIGLRILKKEKL